MPPSLTSWLKALNQTLFTPPCPLCNAPLKPGSLLCVSCWEALPTLPNIALQPDYTVAYAFPYVAPIRDLIVSVKFRRSLADSHLLGQLVAHRLAPRITDKPQALFPVPLHPQRLRTRGFNQALELAKPLAIALNCPIKTDYVIRTKATLAQSRLKALDRQSNIQQAFAITKPIPYRHIALFDDVITTGATLGAIKQLLHQHGVERVDFYACARPPT